MRLLLFDIDGTLVTTAGAGRRALARALRDVFGTAGALDTYDLAGRTDQRIVLDVLQTAGLEPAAVQGRMDDCFEAYARALAAEIGDGRHVSTLPGIATLVQHLDRRSDVVLGLLTGNIEEGARIKLMPTGLWPYFPTGAFGSDHADRRRLPSLAARRAHALTGHAFAPADVLVIGDTPWDVDCAHHFGARAVAVATGRYPRAELAACGANLVFDSFAEVDRALAALLE
ncbi:MAG TPA: HAD hydrolase-like protein [Candidatus Binatia bacterium]|nr:HAD hydrolase-like protein [Candidatus Binatia bacterium]